MTYFFGCDMGGWQNTDTRKGDALAILKWDGSGPQHVQATAAIQYFPIQLDGLLEQQIAKAVDEKAKIIFAIDAALGWPTDFVKLVSAAASGLSYDTRNFPTAVSNPYLYRDTERFIRQHVRKSKDPLTAPGDKFGNNSSKAQMLVAWLRGRLPSVYRPPFDVWDRQRAATAEYTIIEVYPDASRQCKAFTELTWPAYPEKEKNFSNKDISDAKDCVLTAICYAVELGIIAANGWPGIYMPDDMRAAQYGGTMKHEGWIFAPKG